MFQYFTEDTVFTLIYLVDEQLQDQHNTIKTQTQKYFLLKHIILCCQCPIIELIWRVLLVEDNLVLRAIYCCCLTSLCWSHCHLAPD